MSGRMSQVRQHSLSTISKNDILETRFLEQSSKAKILAVAKNLGICFKLSSFFILINEYLAVSSTPFNDNRA